jgi:hypothetical protein
MQMPWIKYSSNKRCGRQPPGYSTYLVCGDLMQTPIRLFKERVAADRLEQKLGH